MNGQENSMAEVIKAAGAWYKGNMEEAIEDVISIGRKQWIND